MFAEMMNLNMDMAATDSFTSLLGQPMGLREFTPQASMMTTRSSSYAQQPQLMELIATDDHQDYKPRAPIKVSPLQPKCCPMAIMLIALSVV